MRNKILVAAVAFAAGSSLAQAQNLQAPGIYLGGEGGANWLLNTTVSQPGVSPINPMTGFGVGGVVGYDFLGPRVELETVYRSNNANAAFAPPGAGPVPISVGVQQTAIMANAYYDFLAGSRFVPYVGAGAGIAFVNAGGLPGGAGNSTQFAYQGIVGVGYNVTEKFRVNLDGRYYGTTSPTTGGGSWDNNSLGVMLGLQYKFGGP